MHIKIKNRRLSETRFNDIGIKSRDNLAQPVQWTSGENALLQVHLGLYSNNYREINVEAAIEDDQSILQTYRKLIRLRHEHDIITYGNIEPLYMDHDELFVYKRHYKDETWLVIANFSKEKVEIPQDLKVEGEVMLQNGSIVNGLIDGFGAIVVRQ